MEEIFEFMRGLGSDLTITEVVFLWLAYKVYSHVFLPLGRLMNTLKNSVEKGDFSHTGPTRELASISRSLESLSERYEKLSSGNKLLN